MRPRLPAAVFPKRSSKRSARRAWLNRHWRVQSAQQCSQPHNRLPRGVLLDVCKQGRILQSPRAWVVLCILHVAIAIGRLLGEFVNREARGITPSLPQDLQVLLLERRAGWNIYNSASPDVEETANFF